MDKKILVQTENHSLYRETDSMALINRDRRSLEIYKARREEGFKAEQLQAEVEQLKSDIGELKSLLQNLARG